MNLAQRLREVLETVDDQAPVTTAERARHAELLERELARRHETQQAALPLGESRAA